MPGLARIMHRSPTTLSAIPGRRGAAHAGVSVLSLAQAGDLLDSFEHEPDLAQLPSLLAKLTQAIEDGHRDTHRVCYNTYSGPNFSPLGASRLIVGSAATQTVRAVLSREARNTIDHWHVSAGRAAPAHRLAVAITHDAGVHVHAKIAGRDWQPVSDGNPLPVRQDLRLLFDGEGAYTISCTLPPKP